MKIQLTEDARGPGGPSPTAWAALCSQQELFFAQDEKLKATESWTFKPVVSEPAFPFHAPQVFLSTLCTLLMQTQLRRLQKGREGGPHT